MQNRLAVAFIMPFHESTIDLPVVSQANVMVGGVSSLCSRISTLLSDHQVFNQVCDRKH